MNDEILVREPAMGINSFRKSRTKLTDKRRVSSSTRSVKKILIEEEAERIKSSAVRGYITLAEKWEKEGRFLCGPGDDISDRQCGQVFLDCAKELREATSKT